MPEVTENYVRIPNPQYSGQAWAETTRTRWLSEREGINALWSPLKASGQWKIRALLFLRTQWPNQDACEAWVREHRDSLKGLNDPMNYKAKSLDTTADARGFGPTPSEDDLALINDLALETLKAEDVYVRRMRLANDQVDREWERFSRGVLDGFKTTLPGKSVLIGHNRGGEPVGRFYKADVARDFDTGVTWLNGYWYTPITDENLHDRKAIDSGIWSYASIGFQWDWAQCDLCGENYRTDKCSHILGQVYPASELRGKDPSGLVLTEDGVRCTVTYRGDAQAHEGSIVYLGAQYDAQMVKAKMAGDLAEEKRLLLEAQKGMDGSVAGESPDGTADDTPEATAEAGQASGDGQAQTESKEATRMSEELGEKLAQAEAALTAAGEKLAAATAETDALRGRLAALRTPVVDEVKTLAATLKRDGEIATMQSIAGEDLEQLSDEKLLALRDGWRSEIEASMVGLRQSTQEDPNAQLADSGVADEKAAPIRVF